jgi:arylformamidase
MQKLDKAVRQSQWIWLSHPLATDTPAYGGGKGLELHSSKSIVCGDSCNTATLTLSNHLGSHVDAPRHFYSDGLTVDTYAPDEWIFSSPFLIDIPLDAPELITQEHLSKVLSESSYDADLLLIRTGFEVFRGDRRFWEMGPGLHPDLAAWLGTKFPRLRAVGIDCISVTSFQHRETGRDAHKALLGAGWRLFEDLALANLSVGRLLTVIALPLRITHGDGAPCTIMARIRNDS